MSRFFANKMGGRRWAGPPIATAVSRYAAFLGLLTGFGAAWGVFLAFSLAENSRLTLRAMASVSTL